ncbi:thioesterase family protein [Pseudorhodobacter sp.]|uniref:acyl-CoA thioesterase n=1 Tax=Pseudorhodobacter sp. TaxID=1934400 RepID=UPI0026485F34|nr:acyl-CoA thioesterase [Pseudorhodobacter sp.]MDN5786665.1 acyl-CoA thioesterase [Pseudorhodobacter sp.]
MPYHRVIQIEFNHCDPAGIVFYPRYFEMTNSVVENFFADVLGNSFAEMMEERRGVPTARLEVNFHAPSRLGEKLDFGLEITRIGRTSVGFRIIAEAGGIDRLTADLTLVNVDCLGQPQPWAGPVRTRMAEFAKKDHGHE